MLTEPVTKFPSCWVVRSIYASSEDAISSSSNSSHAPERREVSRKFYKGVRGAKVDENDTASQKCSNAFSSVSGIFLINGSSNTPSRIKHESSKY